MSSWKYIDLSFIVDDLASQRIESHNLLNLISKHLNADREFLVHGNDFDGVATHPKGAALKSHIVSLVLHIHKFT